MTGPSLPPLALLQQDIPSPLSLSLFKPSPASCALALVVVFLAPARIERGARCTRVLRLLIRILALTP